MFFISHSDKRHDKSPKFICSPVIHQEMRFAAPGRSLQQQHTGSALSKELSLAGRNRILKSKTENKVSLRAPEKQIEQIKWKDKTYERCIFWLLLEVPWSCICDSQRYKYMSLYKCRQPVLPGPRPHPRHHPSSSPRGLESEHRRYFWEWTYVTGTSTVHNKNTVPHVPWQFISWDSAKRQ